jgi:hypothetical protein
VREPLCLCLYAVTQQCRDEGCETANGGSRQRREGCAGKRRLYAPSGCSRAAELGMNVGLPTLASRMPSATVGRELQTMVPV